MAHVIGGLGIVMGESGSFENVTDSQALIFLVLITGMFIWLVREMRK